MRFGTGAFSPTDDSLAPFLASACAAKDSAELPEVLMLVSLIIPYLVSCFMMLEFEREVHGNLKRALWLAAYCLPITGFLASGVIVWYLRKKRTRQTRSG